MSKSYPYPPDEFDTVDPATRPKEVHAARRSTWSKVWPFVVVCIVVPIVAFGVVKYLEARSPSLEGEDTTAPPTPTTTTTVTESAPATSSSPSPSPSASSKAPKKTAKDEPPDRTLPVVILNAKGEAGLAGSVRSILESDSWRNVTAEDYEGENRDGSSAVYYSRNAQASTAKLVADILHIDAEKDKAQAQGNSITVVLRSDFILP